MNKYASWKKRTLAFKKKMNEFTYFLYNGKKLSLLIISQITLVSIPGDYSELDNYNELEKKDFLLHELRAF